MLQGSTVTRIRTIGVLGSITGLVMLVGVGASPDAAWLTGLIALAVDGLAYFYSDRLVLAMHRAYEVTRPDAPDLHRLVAALADRAHVPRPRIYFIDDPRPNAFSTGRNRRRAAIAMTTGLVDVLSRRELRAVIAHEIAHVKNRDILVATIGAMLASLVTAIAAAIRSRLLFALGRDAPPSPVGGILGGVALAIVAPILQLSISHTREYRADAMGAELTGQPHVLARALAKLDRGNRVAPTLAGDPAASTLCIHNPVVGRVATLLSTHPPIGERIARLGAVRTKCV